MEDETVAEDEARRIAQHELTAKAVGRDVNADIAHRAEHGTAEEGAKMDRLASGMRGDAIAEVADTGRELGRARTFARISQVVDYLFALLYGLLVVRLVLALVGARSGNGFVRLINAVTNPFYSLFRGIVASPSAEGGFTLAFPILIAIVVYALLHAAIKGLFRMVVHRQTAV
ncbi:MAG: YggT family protein [Myxococcota bacterium]|nr:YggT family protein [Myxococcota bacterium]